MDAEVWKWVLGAGGVVLSGGLGKFIFDLRNGRVIKEQSAVSTWKDIANARQQEIDRLKRENAWFRRSYASLWRTWMLGPPPGDPSKFPFEPPDDHHTSSD